MNIFDEIVNARNGAAVEQLGSQVGLPPDQVTTALSALLPALAAGFQRNIQDQNGLEDLMAALQSGNHDQYIEDPTSLADQSALADGNGILGHIFGNKDTSREVANRAAAKTGLSAEVLKRLLPLAATLMMGAFARRQRTASPAAAPLGNSGGGIGAMLGPLLDRNRDGSIVDDLLGGLMRRR